MAFFRREKASDLLDKFDAVNKTQGIIEFDLNGNILTANELFLSLVDYDLHEIVGKHHSIFISDDYASSPEYKAFWNNLNLGKADTGLYKRFGKNKKEVWLQASYNPLLSKSGKPYKVIKFAMDVTQRRVEAIEQDAQVAAFSQVMAMISFAPDSTILDANENLTNTLGYELSEIVGQKHSMFVDPTYRSSDEYSDFWDDLRNGEAKKGRFQRVGKGGNVVWIEGSYNPVVDPTGKLIKIVKIASDITSQVALFDNLKNLIDVNFAEIDRAVDLSLDKANTAADAALLTEGNIQTVASASEELAASIHEITSSMSHSQNETYNAVTQTNAASDATGRLADAAASMSGIVTLIQNIAGQINLLALNATIESARAGDAGKGFAVVANEVKNLASQAANATDQISQEIEKVQSVSNEVVVALGNVGTTISSVQEHVTATSSAVEEQSAVTQDMSANMQGAASAVEAISASVQEIRDAVTSVREVVAQTREAAEVLTR